MLIRRPPIILLAPLLAPLLTLLSAVSCSSRGTTSKTPVATEDQQVFYALGMDFGTRLQALTVSAQEMESIKAGLTDALTHAVSRVDMDSVRPKISELSDRRRRDRLYEEKRKAAMALEHAALEPGSRRLPSGIVLQTLHAGTGATPDASDIVTVRYEGRLIDGTLFESSDNHKPALEVGLLTVMSCWRLGIPAMRVGEKARLTCSSELGYGDYGAPPKVPGGAVLVYEIELLAKRSLPPAPEKSPPRPDPVGS